MSPAQEDKLMVWAGRGAVTLLIGLLIYLATELRAQGADHEKRLTTIEVLAKERLDVLQKALDRIEQKVDKLP